MVSTNNGKPEFANPTLSHRPCFPVWLDSGLKNFQCMGKDQLLVSSDLFTFEASFNRSFLQEQLQKGEKIIANQVKQNISDKTTEQRRKSILRPIDDEPQTAHRATDQSSSPDAFHLGPTSNEMDLYPSIFGRSNSTLQPGITDETLYTGKHFLFHVDNRAHTPSFKQRLDRFNSFHGRSSANYHSNMTFMPPLRKVDDVRRSSASKVIQSSTQPCRESRDIVATGVAVTANTKRSTSRISLPGRVPSKAKSSHKSYEDMYSNAMEGGSVNFQQRLAELTTLQQETVWQIEIGFA
ncbi:uncharacterized protein TRIADDRAFT_59223 [Trichoplax adhaerens]|uniref:Uncharacterized protein n=1 Tax=Trichoplax adhaerens TaxID=10228 RepID=B3S574_TRIAD|nr:predicted protein [Trichoplax adhaerens]EDV22087.1 predicted protein [Trichoplax adhaerens]|eukprot:XP_002115242.1 predicted protein [Trichoplax adhaerens]